MREILSEIQAELKEEKTRSFIRNYGPFLAITVVVSIALISGRIWHKDHLRNQSYAQGSQYITAVMKAKSGNIEEALQRFAELHDSPTAYGAAAILHSAHSAYIKKDAETAMRLLDMVITNTQYHDLFRNLAKLYEIEVMLLDVPTNYSKAISHLKVYTESSEPMFKHIAQEKLLSLYTLMGQKDESWKLIKKMKSDPFIPETILARARDYEAILVPSNTQPKR
jgi:hypothetical protein